MTAETVPQDTRERFQVFVSREAAKRIRMVAGAQNVSPGEVVSALAEEHLPAVPKKAEGIVVNAR